MYQVCCPLGEGGPLRRFYTPHFQMWKWITASQTETNTRIGILILQGSRSGLIGSLM